MLKNCSLFFFLQINSLKSNFNEKIVDLRKRKIMLLHDYHQFKFDVYTIQNELNDPEATKTPQNFPKVTIDESIDVRKTYAFYIYFKIIYCVTKLFYSRY